jgi:anti-sigma factor RsiW
VSAHLTKEQLEAYCEKRLSARELLSVSDHLEKCGECRIQTERELPSDALFFDLRSTALEAEAAAVQPAGHLTMEETAAYVDGLLSGDKQQAARDHLSSCELCALAVEDLAAFGKQVAPGLTREYHPARVPTRQRRASFRFMSPAGAFAAALAALLLATAGWWIWDGLRKRTDAPQIVKNEPSATATPATTATVAPLTAQPSTIAQLNDGAGRLILDSDGSLTGADELPDAYKRMVTEALSRRRVEETPMLTALKRPPSSLLGSAEKDAGFSVNEPIGEVVFSDRPTFRWSKWESSASYVVEVYDETYKLIAISPNLNATSWTPPEPLKRGETYSWQVIARKDDQESRSPRPPAPQAKFRVLAHEGANELLKARQAFATSHLALALLYAKHGLLTEAEQELRILVKANPDSEIARSLLANVSSMRRR